MEPAGSEEVQSWFRGTGVGGGEERRILQSLMASEPDQWDEGH